MDALINFSLLIALMLLLLGTGVWVAASLLIVGLAGFVAFGNAPVLDVLSTSLWSSVANWPLTALPLFIWMGEILYRTNLASDMFRGLQPWLAAMPGRLLHVNVFACGIFAAVSGSSAATAATIPAMASHSKLRNLLIFICGPRVESNWPIATSCGRTGR